ncbi:hypothetical protein LP7551_03294 [Roseibium album]|nr:hypothetical protein LP7551_03294 [Roseibium album]
MIRGKIIFKGNFWEFFVMVLGLMILSIVTLGLFLPYLFYWQFKYFFNNMELEIYDNRTNLQN